MTSLANYNGRLTNSGFSKFFGYGTVGQYWKPHTSMDSSGNSLNVLEPTLSQYSNLYVPGNIYLNGTIITTSDAYLKENISPLNDDKIDKFMNLQPKQFTYKNDSSKKIHYGFIAQEFELEYPDLVTITPNNQLKNIKAINYLEIIPMLVNKIQLMQVEINELREHINNH